MTLRCREEAAAERGRGGRVVLEVEDTGRGIAAEQLDRIFEPFVQVESGHTRRAAGRGSG